MVMFRFFDRATKEKTTVESSEIVSKIMELI